MSGVQLSLLLLVLVASLALPEAAAASSSPKGIIYSLSADALIGDWTVSGGIIHALPPCHSLSLRHIPLLLIRWTRKANFYWLAKGGMADDQFPFLQTRDVCLYRSIQETVSRRRKLR